VEWGPCSAHIETPSLENSDATQQLEVKKGMRRQQKLHVKRNPIDPDARQYYVDLLLRLTYEEQEYIINFIIADELFKKGRTDDEVRINIDLLLV
jgi:hypothetical protein